MSEDDLGNGRSTIPKNVNTIIVMVVGGALLAGAGYVINDATWKGEARKQLSQQDKTQADVTTALSVLAQHGTEFSEVRSQLNIVRGELIATRTELLAAVHEKTGDRFRSSDWEKEKRVLEMRFGTIERDILAIIKKLDKLDAEIEAITHRVKGGG